jgi:hypothetical protein
VRRQITATAAVAVALAFYGASCQGGRPVIELRTEESSSKPSLDGSSTTIGDVVTIDSGCATSTTRGQLRPSNLLFVLDRSGSMSCNPPEDGQSSENCATFPTALFSNLPTKWDLTRDAVMKAIENLQTAGTVRVGLTLFPKAATRCTVSTEPDIPIAPLDEPMVQQLQSLLGNSVPGGETPLAGATILSYAHLLEQFRTTAIDGETFVVVVTDGYETCKPDEIPKLLTVDVPNAREQLFVRTFVIGAPGSDAGRALLSQMAVAGGTEISATCTYGPSATEGDCHYDMTRSLDFSNDLLDALTKINAEVLACTIDVPSAPNGGSVNLEEVNVSVNGVSRSMVKGSRCLSSDNGWRYSGDFSTIQLCGDVCRAAKEKGAEVTVILGCPTALQ